MAKLVKRYEYVPPKGEENDGELLVETAGYIPADVKIESMIDAGRRLMDFRAGYEFQDGEEIPDDYLDNTRNPNYDLADAQADYDAALANLQAAKAKAADQTAVVSSVDDTTPTVGVVDTLNPKA